MKSQSALAAFKLTLLVTLVFCTFAFVVNHVCALDSTSGETERRTSGSKQVEHRSRKSSSSDGSIVFECHVQDAECLKDQTGYEAIKALHHMLDDDKNGNVDQSESDEFLRDELQYTDGFERQKTFHRNDKLISVGDLWRAWKGSEVYNWTVDEVLDWLETNVELPQYIQLFQVNAVDGPALPRMACSNSTYFSSILGIKNAVHKQKLSVKSMDAVLFGAPKKAHSYVKDVALVTSLVIAIGGCWFAYANHRYSQTHVKKMMKDLESLQKAEEALMELQEKLDMAEQKQNTVSQEKKHLEEKYRDEIDTAKKEAERLKEARQGNSLEESFRLAEAELAQVRAALKRTEKELDMHQHWTVPAELQVWLQLTHEIEQVHYSAKRQAAERQLAAAKDGCDKIRKRNKAFFGSLRMAHSNSLDDIDQRILDARAALEEVKQDLQERLQRWHAIEQLCGFAVMSNPGLTTLRLILQKDTSGQGPTRVPSTLTGPLAVDEADEDLPPSYPAAILHSAVANGAVRPRALSGYQTLPTVPSKSLLRQRGGGGTGSTGSLSRSVNSSRVMDSPSPTDHNTSNPVSFHLGDNSPPVTNSSGPLLTSSPVGSDALTATSFSNHTNSLPRSGEGHTSAIPHSISYCATPSQSDSDMSSSVLEERSHSTSHLKQLAVVYNIESPGSTLDDEEQDSLDQKKRVKRKKGSFLKFLRKGGTKPKSS